LPFLIHLIWAQITLELLLLYHNNGEPWRICENFLSFFQIFIRHGLLRKLYRNFAPPALASPRAMRYNMDAMPGTYYNVRRMKKGS